MGSVWILPHVSVNSTVTSCDMSPFHFHSLLSTSLHLEMRGSNHQHSTHQLCQLFNPTNPQLHLSLFPSQSYSFLSLSFFLLFVYSHSTLLSSHLLCLYFWWDISHSSLLLLTLRIYPISQSVTPCSVLNSCPPCLILASSFSAPVSFVLVYLLLFFTFFFLNVPFLTLFLSSLSCLQS